MLYQWQLPLFLFDFSSIVLDIKVSVFSYSHCPIMNEKSNGMVVSCPDAHNHEHSKEHRSHEHGHPANKTEKHRHSH